MSLFRPEALAARADQRFGAVSPANALRVWVACAVAVGLAAALVAFVVLGSYARKAHVQGLLAPQGGEVNIAATATGRVVSLRVREGQWVAAGDVLMVIDTDRAALVGNGVDGVAQAAALVARQLVLRREAVAQDRSARRSQADLRLNTVQERLRTLDGELAKLNDEVALQSRRRDLAARSVRRYEELVEAEFVSPIQVQSQQEALLDQDGRLRALERASLSLQRERAALVAERQQIGADQANLGATAERELLALEQEATENTARRTSVVVAPKAGLLSALTIGPGQWITAGQTLAAIQPADQPLQAQLYAPSHTAGFVAVGQAVLLRYGAFPYQKFGLQSGRVVAVSHSAVAPADLSPGLQAQFARPGAEALYRISVALDAQSIQAYGAAHPLKAGMALEADIVQDRRRIIEWMLEPLFAAARRS